MVNWRTYSEDINTAVMGRFSLVHASSKYIEYAYQYRDAFYADKKMFYIEISADKKCRKAGVVHIWSETRRDGLHTKLFDLPSVPLRYAGAIFDAWLDHVGRLAFEGSNLAPEQYAEFEQYMYEVYNNVVIKPAIARDLKVTIDEPGCWSFEYDSVSHQTRAVYKLDGASVLSVRRWRAPGAMGECYLVIADLPTNTRISSLHFPLVHPDHLKEFCDCVIYVCEHEMRRVGIIDEQVFTRCRFPTGDQNMLFKLRLRTVINRYQTYYGSKMYYPQLPH